MPTALHVPYANTTRRLLQLGIAAAPVYLLVGLIQVLTREGFDPRHHALSLLSNGPEGWVQVANFLIAGVLVLAGAWGVRRALHPGRGGTWAPILLAAYGVGLIGAGIFPADPGNGFPPGAELPASGMSTAGLLHFVFGAIGFYGLIGASFVLARRFAASGRRGLVWYSILSGVGFLVAFGAIASGPASPMVMLAFYVAVVWIWIWYAAVLGSLVREIRGG